MQDRAVKELSAKATCSHGPKRQYHARRDAKLAAKRMKQFGFRNRVYQCPNCGHWHLTTKEKRA